MSDEQRLRLECLKLATESGASSWEVAALARQYMDFVLNDFDTYPLGGQANSGIQKDAN